MKTPLRTHTRNLRKHTPRAFPILSTALISLPTTSSCNNIHRLEAVDELYINYLAHVLEFLLYDPNLNATYQAAFNLLHNSRFQPPVNHLERILNASFQRTGGIYYGSELETFDRSLIINRISTLDIFLYDCSNLFEIRHAAMNIHSSFFNPHISDPFGNFYNFLESNPIIPINPFPPTKPRPPNNPDPPINPDPPNNSGTSNQT